MNLLAVSIFALIINSSQPLENIKGDFAFAKSTFLTKNESKIVLAVPFVHQIDNLPEEQKPIIRGTACGPASITMLLKYKDEDVSLMEVINKLPNTVYVKGARFYNLYEGSKYFSKETVRFENSPKNIYDALNKGEPIILNIQNYDGITGHAVVVVGIKGFDGEKAEALIIHDPFVGPYREFEYANKTTLKQPESGYILPIGTLEPFYIK